MKRKSLYEYNLYELNDVDYMARKQEKYSWYDAAIMLSCRELDEYLTLNSNLGLSSEKLLRNYKLEEPGANNVIFTIKKMVFFIKGICDNKKGILTSKQQSMYDKMGKDILEIFDALEGHKEFNMLKDEFDEYLECVSEYFCLSYLEYLSKNIDQGASVSNCGASLYKLLEVVNDNIKNRKVNKEDIEKMNKIASNTDFGDLPDAVISKYLTYIKSFSDTIRIKQINKR